MNSSSLSIPRNVLQTSNYYLEVEKIYNDIFCESPLFGKGILEYKGKKIIFDNYKIDGKHERFWHLISFDPQSDEGKFTVAPCNNLEVMHKCLKEKSSCENKKVMPYHDMLKNRVECYYRMIHINWIEEIITLANNDDQRIEVWERVRKFNNGAGNQTAVHIRFQDYNADYLIVLNDLNTVYKFTTAFPISLLYVKKSYTREFEKYKKRAKK